MTHNYISTGQLVWFTPPVTGGKVAARVIGDIDHMTQTCTLVITATRNSTYPRGYVLHDVPASRIFSRSNWEKVTLAPQWLIYWRETLPRITETFHHGNTRRERELTVDELVEVIRAEADAASPNLCTWVAGYDPQDRRNAGNGVEFSSYRVDAILARLRDHKRLDRGWTTWVLTDGK